MRLRFNEPGARLEVSSEPLEPMLEAGVVREAVLSTSIDASGRALNRLRLSVHCGEAQSLDLVLPEGMSLARVRRDGTEVTPIDSGAGLTIAVPGASQGSKLSTIVLDYVTNGEDRRARAAACEPVLPAISFPCLSFAWDLIAPPGFRAGRLRSGIDRRCQRQCASSGRSLESGSGSVRVGDLREGRSPSSRGGLAGARLAARRVATATS